MLTGILKVLRLPPQCTFWRFLAALHLSAAGQILRVQQTIPLKGRYRIRGYSRASRKKSIFDAPNSV
jgi:hypothetical protein